MASNAPGQPTHSLGPTVSIGSGAPPFALGECVLVRIPEVIRVENYTENDVTIVGTNLPPISIASGPQHFAFVCSSLFQPNGSTVLEVYPVLSFTRSGGALSAYNSMNDATAKAALLPLPPLSSRHPTPDAFGQPLDFGTWSNTRDSFLHIFPRRFTMTLDRSFKRMDPPLIMSVPMLIRISNYRKYLVSTTKAQDHDNQSHPPPNGGGGNSNLPHGQIGSGGWGTASGVTSVTTSPTIIGDGGDGGAVEAGLEKFYFKSTDGLLVLEDVDEDEDEVDATFQDELIMLAHDNPMWLGELAKCMREEEKEKEQIQNERLERLARWREDLAVQLIC